MAYAGITQDDLFDLGFEPLVSENSKTIEYQHPDLGIKLWKGMFVANPETSFWKSGYGQDKIEFQSVEQLQEYMEEVKSGLQE
jgi:hypothetical protein